MVGKRSNTETEQGVLVIRCIISPKFTTNVPFLGGASTHSPAAFSTCKA
jgi:hypothetical protein